MTVEADLFARISTYAGFAALAGTRVYFVSAPQNAHEPYATFSRISSERHHLMGNDAGVVHARFQFDAWGNTPDSARALLEVLRQAIQRHSGTNTVTIDDILLENDLDHEKEDDSKTYHSSIDGIVIYRE